MDGDGRVDRAWKFRAIRRALRRYPPRGRLRASPGPARKPRRCRPYLLEDMEVALARSGEGLDRGGPPTGSKAQKLRGARRAARSSSPDRAPAPLHERPPGLNSGDAYSSTTGCGASARQTTRSCSSAPSSHSSAREQTTRALAIPARAPRAAMNEHLLAWLSTSQKLDCSRTLASASPGSPAPAPMSATRPGARTSSSSRATSESAICASSARADRAPSWARRRRSSGPPAGTSRRSIAGELRP